MGFWEKSRQIFHCLCDNATQSVRRLARQTGLSKSSVHRLTQAIERRTRHPESWFWETAEGRQWLTRLVVATLYTFGLKRGMGVDTMSAFFARLHLETQGGCSPSALRGVRQTLEAMLLATAAAWEQDGRARGEVREIIGAVDETFLECMTLVCMDLSTGSLLLEEAADDRTYVTWHALVEERLKALGTHVLSLVSDRAKALIQLAEQGLECLSMPDCFHGVHDIIKSYALVIGRRLRQARQDRMKAQAALARRQNLPQAAPDNLEVQALIVARQAEVQRWEAMQHTYRHHLERLSLLLHPCRLADSTPQTSAQVESQLHAEVEALEALATRHQLPARHPAMQKVRKQILGLAALVDFWWQGVWQDVEPVVLSLLWRQWVQAYLLPLVYWERQVAHRHCPRRKARIVQALEAVRAACDTHAITHRLAPQVLAEWQAWATKRVNVLQRASSAVEGRNGYVSQMQHKQRGLPTQRYKVWTVLHNFDGRAADGTTPATRFFGQAFPDLFETALSHIEALPRPRQRDRASVRSG
jgi:hypothetical protein